MLIKLSKQDVHASQLMGADTVKLCEMQGFPPRLENEQQSRVEANVFGFKAEFAVARLFHVEPPVVNVLTDGGIDLWLNDISIDVKFTNKERGPLIFDSMEKFKADAAVLVGRTQHDDVMKINGCVSRNVFEWESYKHDFGYGERMVMDVDQLKPIEWLWRNAMEYKFRKERECE